MQAVKEEFGRIDSSFAHLFFCCCCSASTLDSHWLIGGERFGVFVSVSCRTRHTATKISTCVKLRVLVRIQHDSFHKLFITRKSIKQNIDRHSTLLFLNRNTHKKVGSLKCTASGVFRG